jgi:hypothetical protein
MKWDCKFLDTASKDLIGTLPAIIRTYQCRD